MQLVNSTRHIERLSIFIIIGIVVVTGIGWYLVPQNYIPDDMYFYLVIARNIVLKGQQTFSGIIPTNGVHPLWQILTAGYSWILNVIVGSSALYNESFYWPLSLTVLSLGLWRWWRTSRLIDVPPIVICGLTGVFLGSLGLLISEAHIQYFMVACLANLLADARINRGNGSAFVTGLVGGLTVLSRLDLLFLVSMAPFFWLSGPGKVRRLSAYALGCGLVVGPYLLTNLVWFGGLMPVSGWMKSSFPHIVLRGFNREGISVTLSGYSLPFGLAPIALSIFVLATNGVEKCSARRLLATLLAGALGNMIYIMLFTHGETMTHWYYVLPATTGALAAAILAKRYEARVPLLITLFACSLLAASIAAVFVRRGSSLPVRNQLSMEFFSQLSPDLNLDEEAILVSDAPGYLAFKTKAKVFAADLLTANRRFYEEMRASPNALNFILDACARQGSPVRAVFYVGGFWLTPTDNMQSLVFRDPRSTTRPLAPLARIDLGPPTFVPTLVKGGSGAAWRLAPSVRAASAP
jgi:hypothetical protein